MPYEKEYIAMRMGQLVTRQLHGDLSPEEAGQLESWLQTSESYREVYEDLLDEAKRQQMLKHALLTYQAEEALPKVWQKYHEAHPVKKMPLWKKTQRIAAAAIILIALSLGIYFYFANYTNLKSTIATLQSNDIDPGGNRAILTLADGRKIMLDDAANGELAEESGINITKTEDGQLVYEVLRHAPQARASEAGGQASQSEYPAAGWRASAMRDPATYNTIETPRGGQYKIILPDGSTVWLNSASSLRYPTRFDGAERRVELTGEAYFQISSKYQVEEKRRSRDIVNASIKTPNAQAGGDGNKSKIENRTSKIPFIVATATQEVTVLGTQFNINAYTDEAAVKTTLVEGAVSVRVASTSDKSTNQPINPPVVGHGQSTTLRPNQQSVLSGRSLAVVDVDPTEYIAWKDRLFIFHHKDLGSIMRQLSKWYDVEFELGDIPDELYYAEIPMDTKLSEVLYHLEKASGLTFTIKERRVTVEK